MSKKSATERLREMLDERGVEWKEHRHVMPGSMAIQRETLWGQPTDVASGKPIPHVYHYRATEMGDGRLFLEAQLGTPEQAIAATLDNERLAFLKEKVKRQGDYIDKLTKEKSVLFAQNCEAAARHAGQMDRMQRKLEAATLGNDGLERSNDGVDELQAENARLRERITTQKQTVQAYRDESREWREVAERAQAENEQLRELLQDVAICACGRYCYGCPHQYDGCDRDKRLKAEGIEVDE